MMERRTSSMIQGSLYEDIDIDIAGEDESQRYISVAQQFGRSDSCEDNHMKKLITARAKCGVYKDRSPRGLQLD